MAKPAAAPAREAALLIWGAEMLLVGGLAAAIAWRVPPDIALVMCAAMAAIAGVLTEALRRPAWRPTADAILALCLSFGATPPGIFFFLELMNRNGGICYERPWFSVSFSWLLIGPALFAFSKIISPWRLTSPSLFIVRCLHVLVWLLGAGNTFMCAMTV